MTAQEAFAPILDSDETIIESFVPNKKRFILLAIIFDFLKSLFGFAFGTAILVFSTFADWRDDQGNRVDPLVIRIIGYVVIGFCVFCVLLAIVWRIVKFKKIYFCYTNKRILVRTGFIGADFQTLDYDMIGAMNVRVDFFDKFVHPNTGTLIFASAASPMMQNGLPGGTSGFMFVNIEHPYEVYKRIKEFSASHKDGVLNS